MNKYSVYVKIRLPMCDATAGKDMELFGEDSLDVAKQAKEMNKDKTLLYIEVANIKEDEIKFYDGNTLELFKTL